MSSEEIEIKQQPSLKAIIQQLEELSIVTDSIDTGLSSIVNAESPSVESLGDAKQDRVSLNTIQSMISKISKTQAGNTRMVQQIIGN